LTGEPNLEQTPDNRNPNTFLYVDTISLIPPTHAPKPAAENRDYETETENIDQRLENRNREHRTEVRKQK